KLFATRSVAVRAQTVVVPPGTAPTGDPLGRARRRSRNAVIVGGLSLTLVISVILALGIGPVLIAPDTVAQILTAQLLGWPEEPGGDLVEQTIVWNVRVPRVLLGLAVGAGLAVCGMALQAMVRNVLADPYLLGINSGASSGAAATILFGLGVGVSAHALTVSAFLGALGASLLVFLIARAGGRVTSIRLLLAGVAVGYALSAVTSFMIFLSGSAEGARSVMFWLLGSLALAEWGSPLLVVCAVVVFTTVVLTLWSARLDALAIGDETAHILGV